MKEPCSSKMASIGLIAILLLLLPGCGFSPASYKPAPALPPIVTTPSVTPAAKQTSSLIAAMQPFLDKIRAADLPAQVKAAVEQLYAAWQAAGAASVKAEGDAVANDTAVSQNASAIKTMQADYAALAKQSAEQEKQIVADKSAFQSKLDAYSIIIAILTGISVALILYTSNWTNMRGAVAVLVSGVILIVVLRLIGWVDENKVAIALCFIGAGLAYIVAETAYHMLAKKMTFLQALKAALTEDPFVMPTVAPAPVTFLAGAGVSPSGGI